MDFRVTRLKRESYFAMDSSHVHNFYEVYYLINGTRKYFIDDSIYTINRGDVVVILKDTIHRTTYLNDKTHERMDCKFDEKYLNDIPDAAQDFIRLFRTNPVVHLSYNHQIFFERLMKNIQSESENPDEYSAVNAQSLLHQLIICLVRLRKLQSDTEYYDYSLDDNLMQEAARYIRINFSKPLDLDSIARHVNISPTYFSKKFKAATGFGYREYLVNVRLQEASRMLLETKRSVTEIALKCGFNDSNYFGDVFRKAKGVSPLKYRKNNKFY